MAEELDTPIRRYIDKYWRPFASLVFLVLSALTVLEQAHVSPVGLFGESASVKRWFFLGICATLLVAIRFPRLVYWVHIVLFPRPGPPVKAPRIFRGPEPFGSGDQGRLPGRERDRDECLRRIDEYPFFVLEGESGCGKSSLLEAAVLPALAAQYHVFVCRVASDPFGKIVAAVRREPYRVRKEPVGRQALAMAVNEATGLPVATEGEPRKPVLLCIDQFEELFFTVRDAVRTDLAVSLRQLIDAGKLRVVIGIRSDFSDLLGRLCRTADPDHQTLNLRNYHTLRAFLADEAEAVTNELLRPLHDDHPVRKLQAGDFAKELVVELLRPPADPRLSHEDEKTVLPVELQMVGMMLELSGVRNLAPGALRRLGGKVGVLKAYIEDVKTYVWRKTGVPGPQAMLILRKLVSPAGTKWAVTTADVGDSLKMAPGQVKEVLEAFEERYLVKRLTYYGLRHRYGLMGIKNGVNLKLLSLCMGHARTQMTEHYIAEAGLTEQVQRAACQVVLATALTETKIARMIG